MYKILNFNKVKIELMYSNNYNITENFFIYCKIIDNDDDDNCDVGVGEDSDGGVMFMEMMIMMMIIIDNDHGDDNNDDDDDENDNNVDKNLIATIIIIININKKNMILKIYQTFIYHICHIIFVYINGYSFVKYRSDNLINF